MVCATTGHAFIRAAWNILHRTNFSGFKHGPDLWPRAYFPPLTQIAQSLAMGAIPGIGAAILWTDSLSLNAGKYFNTSSVGVGGVRGTRWDNDFNRALWCWVWIRWQVHATAVGEPSVSDQYNGLASSASKAAWMNALRVVEACERNQSVSPEALTIACAMVAYQLGLVTTTYAPAVSLEPGTVPMHYNQDPPNPGAAADGPGHQFFIWPVTSGPKDARQLSDIGVLPPLSITPGLPGAPVSPGTPGTPGALMAPPAARPTDWLMVTGVALGGVIVIGGVAMLVSSVVEKRRRNAQWTM